MHPSYSFLTMEEELSLAYLHAVCARADMSCIKAERSLDNDGIDALAFPTRPIHKKKTAISKCK